jgi:hypothetical protein
MLNQHAPTVPTYREGAAVENRMGVRRVTAPTGPEADLEPGLMDRTQLTHGAIMKSYITAALGLALLAGCESREETGRAVDAADTIVTTRQEMDTAVVTQDTTVEVDTNRVEGEAPVSEDTIQK